MEEKSNAEELLRAYGPEKEAWKAAGNYFIPEELKRMEKDFESLTLKRRSKRVYVVD